MKIPELLSKAVLPTIVLPMTNRCWLTREIPAPLPPPPVELFTMMFCETTTGVPELLSICSPPPELNTAFPEMKLFWILSVKR